MKIITNKKEEEAIEKRFKDRHEKEFEFISKRIITDDIDYSFYIKVKRNDEEEDLE